MNRPARLLALLVVVLSYGCARPLVVEPGADLGLDVVDSWNAGGRIAVARAGEGFNGGFTWRQREESIDLTVRGPLGFGAMAIRGDDAELSITHRGETLPLEDPERDLSQIVGWWVPVGSLSAWLRALPDPRFPAQLSRDEAGLLRRLEQRGWTASYESYRRQGQFLVPRKFNLENGDVNVRVVVDRWSVED